MIEEQTQKKAALSKRKKDPKTNEDFAVLYNELEAWRIIEVAKIKVTGNRCARNACKTV